MLRTAFAATRSAAAAAAAATSAAWTASASPAAATAVRTMASHSFDLNHALVWGDMPRVPATVEATDEELLHYFKQMYTVRRMEISCDVEYKNRNIRGFCHLYDGQEAVSMGIMAALDPEDCLITAYRCHGITYMRGETVEAIVAELMGRATGNAHGKGGSMHLYSPENNYFGGCGIVGAQVPLGAGLAFANKYKTKEGERMPISVSMYGDGAANQGQIWEAANMSKLWGLPAVFVIENNTYGMGTSSARHSSNPEYYSAGGANIPGLRADGMDVLAAREAMKTAKEFVSTGNGPIFLEYMTYRYHGHSMSDPGISYRSREEVQDVRKNHDCVAMLRKRIIDNEVATEAELKAIEKAARTEVAEAIERAKAAPFPDAKELYTDVLHDVPAEIRGCEITTGFRA